MRFTTAEIAAATGGEVFGREVPVVGASIDSRSAGAGQLFVPLVADRDGHDFIGAALKAGAGAYLTSGPIEAGTAVRVADTTQALADIGRWARSRLNGPVIAVTGSVGKTSLKDLLAAACASTFRTAAAVGSFNNELGVPLTLANAEDDTEVAVLEMGARGRGHVAMLCELARPTVGICTVVAGAHMEMFRTLEEVAGAKAEIVTGLPSDGTAVLNADDHRVAAMASVTEARVLTFGIEGGDVRATDIELDDVVRARFTLNTDWGAATVRLGVAGRHQVVNALGAAAAALSVGVPIDAVAAGLGEGRLSAMRMDLTTLASGALLLDDAYNANPTSMVAALDALASTTAERRIAVLGTMSEIGDESARAHMDVAAEARDREIALVTVDEPRYGDEGPGLHPVADPDDAVRYLQALPIGSGDAVLVKASRSARLERVTVGLQGDAAVSPPS